MLSIPREIQRILVIPASQLLNTCQLQLRLALIYQDHHVCYHMGPEDPSNQKKYPSFFLQPNFRKLQNDSKNASLKIGSKGPQKLGPFFSLFLMIKTLSSGQEWFLRPYFPLIRGVFLLRSGLRFSFWALEVRESKVRKTPLSLTEMAFSSLSDWALPVPETKI